MSAPAIRVEGLSKKFCRTTRDAMRLGTLDVLGDIAGARRETGRLRNGEFWALDGVDFELPRGGSLGVIGPNGCGKTTLLRLLNGIYLPDRGRITVRGRIGALIAIGAGFHPQLTGRENVLLNGSILGLSKSDLRAKMDSIVSFADIGDFLDAPVATYSSGMKVRLGFAVAIHAPIEILLADEVLAVGDLSFKAKCFDKLAEARARGVSVVLVSHDMSAIASFCERALLLDKGRVAHFGAVEDAIKKYYGDFLGKIANPKAFERVVEGGAGVRIEDVRFSPEFRDGAVRIAHDGTLRVEIDYDSSRDVEDVEVISTLILPVPVGAPYFQAANAAYGVPLSIRKGRGTLTVVYRNLRVNNYKAFFSIGVSDRKTYEQFLWWRHLPVEFTGNPLSSGFTHADVDYRVTAAAPERVGAGGRP